MIFKTTRNFLSLWLLVFSYQAYADFNDENLLALLELMETDIATGTSLEQRYTPAVTSVVSADDIQRSGARTLFEALEQVPGLHVYPSKNFVMKPGVSIRGVQTVFNSQVLILIDGVRQNSALNGSPVLHFMMPTSSIQRIEVIRGPGSALYGADAFSGVINVVTKKYVHIEEEFGIRYGSFNTQESWLNTRGETGDVKMGLTLSLMKSDGDKSRVIENDRQTLFDGLFGTNASLAPGAINSEYQTLYVSADASYKNYELNFTSQNSQNIGTHDGAGRSLDPTGKISRMNMALDLKHSNRTLFNDTLIKSSMAYTYSDGLGDYVTFPPGASLPFGAGGTLFTFPDGAIIKAGAKESSYQVKTNLIYKGANKHTINVGLGLRYEKLSTTDERNFGAGVITGTLTDVTGSEFTFLPDESRTNVYALLQDEYVMSRRLRFTSGIRYDHYNDFGSTVNPRLALVWQKNEDLTFKAMYGRAFRAPSFGELYFRNNPVNLGNVNVQPETIDTVEVAMDYRAPVYTKLNIFYYQAKDLIDSVPNIDGTVSAQNNTDQNGYGLEIELEYQIYAQLLLSGNYAYQKSENADTKQPVADAPVQQLFVQLQYQINTDWGFNAQYNYIGERKRSVNDPRPALQADSLVNLTLQSRNIWKNVDVLVSVRNAFNQDYREPSLSVISNDYPMRSRYIFGEVRYRF